MSRAVELSCDLGEAVTDSERAVERAIWPMITAANVACGGHVGDVDSMREAIARCLEFEITLGAHPSYPDREGFGRRHVDMTFDDLVSALSAQLDVLRRLAADAGLEVERVKPHGALYNEAQKDDELAAAVLQAVTQTAPGAALVCAAGSAVERACSKSGARIVREAFVDRRYESNGSLQPRAQRNSLLIDPDEAAAQALRLAERGAVIAVDGSEVRIEFETLCAHSDMPGSVDRIRTVRERLEAAGFPLRGTRAAQG
jgi:UPF0271 protein